jgi:hypothetical protein
VSQREVYEVLYLGPVPSLVVLKSESSECYEDVNGVGRRHRMD